MRKNSVRKWLHAILDLLPLFVIPIFAIYTRNENYNSNIELQVQENKEVAFNQLLSANYATIRSNYYVNVVKSVATSNTEWVSLNQLIDFVNGHKYYIRVRQLTNNYAGDYILMANQPSTLMYFSNSPLGTIVTLNNKVNDSFGFVFNNQHPQGENIEFYINLIDLTFMFGGGNEPTQSEFDEWYTENYYEYTTYKKEILPLVTTTYNDTDVGSQFVYTLYNATDKYFNCTNLFNLEQVWNWVQLNLFNGNAPLMVYVVWQVIVYEFFMDLIFLLYSVFMFVIDFAENCIDRFTGRANRC